MDYQSAFEYICRSYTRGFKHGDEVVGSFLREMGDPHEKLNIIHVAGTNGKGSVCTMISSILREQGYTVGVFTSPHLITFNERVSINGKIISDEEFADEIRIIKELSAKIFDNDYESLSFFEILTLMAFHYFNLNKVDFAVIEVGIGGRHDVTNIISKPMVSVIAAIGYDHMEMLGDTIEQIAYEKGGIIKENRPVALYLTSNAVYNTINSIAVEKNSKLYYTGEDLDKKILKKDLHETIFSVSCDFFSYERIKIKLIGDYQVYNTICVLLCVEALRDIGIKLETRHVLDGLALADWPGRLEIVGNSPLVILDGAHNIDAAYAVKSFVRDFLPDRRIVMVIGILRSKSYEQIIDIITDGAETVIMTQPVSAKSVPADVLAGCVSNNQKTVMIEPDYMQAYEKALSIVDSDGVVIIAGSLYLVGDIRRYLIGKGVIADDRFQRGDK